jgi:hypothetical protein
MTDVSSSRRCRRVLLAVGATAVALTGCDSRASSAAQPSSAHGPALDAVGSGVKVIDASIGETFTPLAEDAVVSTEVLSPRRAYRRADSGRAMPTDVEHYLGYLTGQFIADHQLVYAFTAPVCGPRFGPVSVRDSTPSPSAEPAHCTQWELVDARSGKMLDQTWTH